MKKTAKMFPVFALSMCILCGCAGSKQTETSTNDKGETEKTQNVTEDKGETDKKNILLTDLQNCDLTFMKNMMSHDFTAELYSSENLNRSEIMVSFDSDIHYDVKVTQESAVKRYEFGNKLLHTYNRADTALADDMGSDDGSEENPAFFKYRVFVNLDTEEENIEYFDDLEINTMTVSYGDQVYDFDIGTIKFEPKKKFNEKFADQLAGENSAIVKTACQMGASLEKNSEGLFEIDLTECILTEQKEMTITSIGLSNVNGINLKEAEIVLRNDGERTVVKYEEGDELTIPKNTLADIKILGQVDSLKSEKGGCFSVSVDVGYRIDGKDDSFQYQVRMKEYLQEPEEI